MGQDYWFIFNKRTHQLLGVYKDYREFADAMDSLEYSGVSTEAVCCISDSDYLKNMLNLQKHFQARLGCEFDTQYIMNHALYAEAELHEMLRELEGFKAWKNYSWSPEEQAKHLAYAKEEFIDVLHFIWNIALALGLTSEEIMELYAEKNAENHARQDRGY